MRWRSFLAVAVVLLLCPRPSGAQTIIHVPGDQPTIQAGIVAAHDGDTVLVAPGTYTENIDFLGKAITVTSSGGAANTIIEGVHTGATVNFENGETRASVLSKLTITAVASPTSETTGGIAIGGASPSILNNTITANHCWGINAYDNSFPLIQGNEISHTLAQSYVCGGFGVGSGIAFYELAPGPNEPLVLGNVIENNTESGLVDGYNDGGAGIFVVSTHPLIAGNIIRNNATGKYPSTFGGGGGYGGGIQLLASEAVLMNNLIYGNTSNLGGGGVAIDTISSGRSVLMFNNTIVDNAVIPLTSSSQSVVGGEQIYYIGVGSEFSFYNNMVSGSTSNPSVVCVVEANSPSTYKGNDFYNTIGPITGTYGSTGTCIYPSGTSGNISADPQFASPAAHDYHLTGTSPAVDTGDNSGLALAASAGTSIATDLDGNARVQDATAKACAIVDMGAYEYPGVVVPACNQVTETLVSSLNPSTFGAAVSFTAQVAIPGSVPTGSIQFADGAAVLATQPLSATGVAAFSTSALAVGTHPITAVYQPTGSFSPGLASLSQVVTGYPTSTALTCSPNDIAFNATALLNVLVSSASGTPMGSIALTDNGSPLSTLTLAGGAASYTYTGLAAGAHTLTANYAGSGAFAGSSASCVLNVDAAPTVLTLTSSANPSPALTPITFTAHLTTNGRPVSGSSIALTLNAQSFPLTTSAGGTASYTVPGLISGSYPVTATFAAPVSLLQTSAASLTETVLSNPTATTLIVSPNPGVQGQTITLTATVAATAGSAAPTGSIQFFDGATLLQSVALTTPSGATLATASFQTSSLAPGTHALTAVYPGSYPNSFLPSASAPVSLFIAPRDFSLTSAQPSITIQTGHHGSLPLTLTSIGGFAGAVSLACGPSLPPNVTCELPHSGVSLNANAPLSVTLTLDTDAVLGYLSSSRKTPQLGSRLTLAFAAMLPLALFPLAGRPGRRRLHKVICLAAVFGGLTSCSSQYPASTPPGTYTIPLAATGTDSANAITMTHTLTLTLNVTP